VKHNDSAPSKKKITGRGTGNLSKYILKIRAFKHFLSSFFAQNKNIGLKARMVGIRIGQ